MMIVVTVAALSALCGVPNSTVAVAGTSTSVASPSGTTAYAVLYGSVVGIRGPTNAVSARIGDAFGFNGIAIAPDGRTAYALSVDALYPIDLTQNVAGAPIPLPFPCCFNGGENHHLAITPDGKTAYAASTSNNTVVAVDLATHAVGPPITVTPGPAPKRGAFLQLAITPDGKLLYVSNEPAGTVTPISTATGKLGTPIKAPYPDDLVITPDGATLYVVNGGGRNTVTPIAIATRKLGTPIKVTYGYNLAITPDGATLYVGDDFDRTVIPISTATKLPGKPIRIAGPKNLSIGVTVSPDGQTVYASQWGGRFITPISTATNRAGRAIDVGALLESPSIAFAPDEGPVAKLSVSPSAAGSGVPTEFDASESVGPSSPIVSYEWNFGDGQTATTPTPTTSHTYQSANTYTASVTETDAVGTSTEQVFTGQTMSRNGGPGAVATAHVVIVSCTTNQTCAGSLSVPKTGTVPAHTVQFTGTPTAALGTVQLEVAPASLVCPHEDASVAPVGNLTDTGFDPTDNLTVTTTSFNTIRASIQQVCFDDSQPFLSQANPATPKAGTALLLDCTTTGNVAPCVVSRQQVGPNVAVTFLIPGGDGRFHIVQPAPVKVNIPIYKTGTHGQAYSVHFYTTGGLTPVTWHIARGTLPKGLNLNPNTGTITGKPAKKGSFTFAVEARDAEAPPQTSDMNATVTIK